MKLNIFAEKNTSYFQGDKHIIDCNNIQNYNPIYDDLFKTDNKTSNDFQLNYKWNTTDIICRTDHNVVTAQLKNGEKTKQADVFIKYSPLLDPVKYLAGKYTSNMFKLPSCENNETVHAKLMNYHNNAYVDGFFSYITSRLLNENDFVHGLDFYGSYLANQTDYRVNIYDDYDFLCSNKNFIKRMDKFLQSSNLPTISRPRLTISEDIALSAKIFKMESTDNSDVDNSDVDTGGISLNELKLESVNDEMMYKTESEGDNRSSDEDPSDEDNCYSSNESNSELDSDSELEYSSDEEEEIFAYIEEFPVNMICLERCVTTLDEYMVTHSISEEEWAAVLMQIIMTLLKYQRCFQFTHNDLHTNNVMYCETDKEYLYYHFNSIYYKVPTFGKIWKIIDFGRAIYTVNDKTYASDCFFPDEDAYSQYNCEPFFNPEKKRVPPNNSFDLCRLACSLYDFFVDTDVNKLGQIPSVVMDWCKDDKGKNILYKRNGDERYPEFKLYKMIARIVHKHTPEAQLDRALFKQFIVIKKSINKKKKIMNIE